MPRHVRILFIVVVTVLIVAVGYRQMGFTVAPVYVTARVERGDIIKTVVATGTVNAVVSVAVGSELSGRLEQLFVDFNDTVRRGQPIAQLDQQGVQAEVNRAAAALNVGRAELQIRQAGVERAASVVASRQAERRVKQARIARTQAVYDEAKRALARKSALRGTGAIAQDVLDQVKAAFAQSEADLRAAQAVMQVHEQEIVTAQADLRRAEAERSNAEAQIAQLEAALRLAEVKLARTVIRSPIDGIVIGRDVDTGQTVAASLEAPKLFTIAQDLKAMEVHAKVDEADIGQIRLGQPAGFTVDAFPNRSFAGQVVQIRKSPEKVDNVVSYTVVISADNPELLLLPGMTALVQITVHRSHNVVKLPNRALHFRPGDAAAGAAGEELNGGAEGDRSGTPATVWRLDRNGRPVAVPVRFGASDAQSTELQAGNLAVGQELVVGRRQSSE